MLTYPSLNDGTSADIETETSAENHDYVTGDVNGDGKVTSADARLALRAGGSLITLEGTAFEAADVNGDGRVTAKDGRSILRFAAKLASSF